MKLYFKFYPNKNNAKKIKKVFDFTKKCIFAAMKKTQLFILTILLLSPILLSAQTLRAYRGQVADGYNFWVSTPKDYDSVQSDKPIILFLHGASLCGRNLERVRRYGPLDALAMGRQIDAIIIAPQNPGGAWKPDKINNVVDWVFEHYKGDTNRFYVLGMSLGGYGTIDYSAAYPHRIAAAMALCGGGNPKSYCGLNDLPLWILHGTADRAVRISQSEKVINAMSKCGESPRLRFTRLPGVDHGGLARAFYITETYDWLFEHRLDTPDRPVNTNYEITVNRLRNAYKDINRHANHLIVHNTSNNATEISVTDSNTTFKQNDDASPKYHTIRRGDTLGALAKRHHTTVNHLCKLNGISPNTTLRIGRRLRVK